MLIVKRRWPATFISTMLCIEIQQRTGMNASVTNEVQHVMPAVHFCRGNTRQDESKNVDGNTHLALDLLV